VPADELASRERAGDRPRRRVGGRLARLSVRRFPGPAGRWLSIFGASLALLIVRFLVPAPVGQADNRDGPRLMCGRGLRLGPVVPRGDPRFFRFAYFEYAPSASCAHARTYPSSEVVPLELARLLTPLLRLPGTLNLIALGLVMCVLASIGIASLATGLRLRLWAQLLMAAVIWLIMADAAFFDVYASPFSDPAALVGLLLVAAGVVYLGRGWRPTLRGLALAGTGGVLVIASKEQYLILAVPICLTLILASADRGQGGGWRAWRWGGWSRRLGTRQTGAAVTVAALLGVTAAGYWLWDHTSRFAAHLHHEQAVNMIFEDIVNGHDHAAADLRALGLPVSWAKYAGDYYWKRVSVRNDPLYDRYEARLTDGTIARFLLTHPSRMISIGQQAASLALRNQTTSLGDYPPSAGHPPGAVDSRVVVLTWLVHRLPPRLGLLWLLPLWTAMAAVAAMALSRRRGEPWHRDGAAAVLCMTGCAILAFIPPAYFDGISTTRHMVGMNLATALAFPVSIALAVSMIRRRVARPRPHPQTPAAPGVPELATPGS
jgi:hypothetical protein